MLTGTELRVCEDIAKRQEKGFAKYGMTVEENPLGFRQWMQHAYEETLDQAVYLKRMMEKWDESFDFIDNNNSPEASTAPITDDKGA